jgi:hypothetical protein
MMFIVTYFLAKLWEEVLNTTRTFQLIFLSVTTIASGVMIYVWSSYLLRIPEIETYMGMLNSNLKKVAKKLKIVK